MWRNGPARINSIGWRFNWASSRRFTAKQIAGISYGMKPVRLALILLLVVAALAAYLIVHPNRTQVVNIEAKPAPSVQIVTQQVVATVAVETNEACPVEAVQQPVQSIEDRGDAMLFEIDALNNTPFDRAITQPFD